VAECGDPVPRSGAELCVLIAVAAALPSAIELTSEHADGPIGCSPEWLLEEFKRTPAISILPRALLQLIVGLCGRMLTHAEEWKQVSADVIAHSVHGYQTLETVGSKMSEPTYFVISRICPLYTPLRFEQPAYVRLHVTTRFFSPLGLLKHSPVVKIQFFF